MTFSASMHYGCRLRQNVLSSLTIWTPWNGRFRRLHGNGRVTARNRRRGTATGHDMSKRTSSSRIWTRVVERQVQGKVHGPVSRSPALVRRTASWHRPREKDSEVDWLGNEKIEKCRGLRGKKGDGFGSTRDEVEEQAKATTDGRNQGGRERERRTPRADGGPRRVEATRPTHRPHAKWDKTPYKDRAVWRRLVQHIDPTPSGIRPPIRTALCGGDSSNTSTPRQVG